MGVEERCPDCGGTARRLLSPGLCECTNVITWTAREEVTEYVMQDDPSMFYNFGLRGTRQVPVTRWANVPRSRVCGTVYEVEAPVTTVPCALRPGNRACGAFAVGQCSECGVAVCRYHGSYFDSRMLCETCRARIEAARAEHAARQEAEQLAAAERERRLTAELVAAKAAAQAARAAEQDAAYERLPVMTYDDWAAFLRATDGFVQVGDVKRPTWMGKRPGQLTTREAAALFRACGFSRVRVPINSMRLLGRRWYSFAQGWIVAEGSTQTWRIDSNVTTQHLVVVLEDGRVVGAELYGRNLRKFHGTAFMVQWQPDAESLTLARRRLHGKASAHGSHRAGD
jgi:uncharacterized Zn finger protein (UPF0148 family)